MSASTVSILYAQIRALSLEDQRTLNSMIVANIRLGMKTNSMISAIKFNRDDVVKFNAKTRGQIFIKITGFSRDLSRIKGVQLNTGWKTQAGTPWTVGASACTASTAEAAADASKLF